jgi:iron-sulfur cluster repair protein YtfE (RIC family)
LEKLGGSTNTAQARIPESMRAEHERIQSSLVRATKLPGPVGAAARQLADVLHPHFVREEQIALPPLGLLEPLVRGSVTPDVRAVLAMTDSLRTELPRMLEEHKAIRAATSRLGDVARRARNTTVVALTEELRQHAQTEEEILYPAAVLVGEVVRARSGAARTSASR